MSTENKNTETTVKFKFVSAIMAILKLGDSGKLDSFFGRLVRDFERAVSQLDINLSILKSQHEQAMTSLEEQLEDAKQAVEDAWLNVKAEDVATNAQQEAFKDGYIHNIERAESLVDLIEGQIKDAKEQYDEEVKEMKDQIKAYKARIAKIK